MNHKFTAFALLATLSASAVAVAQDDKKDKPGRPRLMQQRPGNDKKSGPPSGFQPGENLRGMLGGPGMGMMMQMLPVMAALDTDQDGALSSSEIENASKSLLKLDKDGDGLISAEEMRPDPSKMKNLMGGMMQGGPGGGPGGPPTAAMMMKMFENRDKDGDGKLSGDEIPEPMRNRVSMIDKDGDGSIQKSELEQASEMMGDRGPRPGRGNGNDGSGVKPKRPPE